MKKRSRILHTETRTSHCIAPRLSLVNFKHCSGQKITISVPCCVIKEDVIVFHFPGRKTRKIRLDSNYFCRHTVFENHRKSLIQHCERSELRLHFEWTKSWLEMPKIVHFWACGQTVLPDRSFLIGQKLVENAKMPKFNFLNNVFSPGRKR